MEIDKNISFSFFFSHLCRRVHSGDCSRTISPVMEIDKIIVLLVVSCYSLMAHLVFIHDTRARLCQFITVWPSWSLEHSGYWSYTYRLTKESAVQLMLMGRYFCTAKSDPPSWDAPNKRVSDPPRACICPLVFQFGHNLSLNCLQPSQNYIHLYVMFCRRLVRRLERCTTLGKHKGSPFGPPMWTSTVTRDGAAARRPPVRIPPRRASTPLPLWRGFREPRRRRCRPRRAASMPRRTIWRTGTGLYATTSTQRWASFSVFVLFYLLCWTFEKKNCSMLNFRLTLIESGNAPRFGGYFQPAVQELCRGREGDLRHVCLHQHQRCPCLCQLWPHHQDLQGRLGIKRVGYIFRSSFQLILASRKDEKFRLFSFVSVYAVMFLRTVMR